MTEPTEGSSSEHESKIEELVDEFVRARRSGDSISQAEIVSANPELEPALSQRLESAESLVAAIEKVETEETVHFGPAVSERLRCPHCGNIVQIVDDTDDITCGSCGSGFSRDEEQTQQYSPSSAQIAHFELLERVGRGGFGVVYRAKDTRLNRDVALKIPRRGYFGTKDEEERFLREARSAANLKHPNIVQVFEVGTERGSHYIAAEFIDGQNLADMVKGQLLPFRRTATLLGKIAEALHHAHEQGVIHRDVKPANILIDAKDEPFLTDFGLARDSEPAITVTRDGEVLGTPAYMSPEQAAAEHSRLDRRSDIYSLGVALFRMLSGELPFRGSRRMLLNKVLHDDPPLIRSLNEDVPKDLETIALRAMEKQPEKRYQTALEFAQEIQRWLAGDPILARPISRFERAWRWCRKRPLIASMLATIVLLLCTISVGGVVWGFRENRLKQDAQASDVQSRERLAGALAAAAADRLNDDDSLGSLPYAVESLGVQTTLDSDDAALTRIQINTTLANSPRLLHVEAVGDTIGAIVRRPDGEAFAVASGKTIRLYDMDWRKRGADLNSAHDVWQIAFSGDGQRLLAFNHDYAGSGGATVWSTKDGQQVAGIKHAGLVDACFSPDGTRVATGGGQGEAELKVWSAVDGDLQLEMKQSGNGILNLQFSPDGQKLAALSFKPLPEAFQGRYWLSVWTLATQEETTIPIAGDGFLRFAFLEDGRILTMAESGLMLRYGADGTPDETFRLHSGTPAIQSSTMHNQGPIVTLANDAVFTRAYDSVKIWDLGAPQLRLGPISHGGPIYVAGFTVSPDEELFATAGKHDRVNIFRTSTGERVGPSIGHGDTVHSAEFLADSVLATGTASGVLKIWDLSGICRGSAILPHDDRVTSAKFSPDSQRVVTTSQDEAGKATIWSRTTGEQISQVEHGSAALVSAFSPDGRTVVSADENGRLLVRNAFGVAENPEPLPDSGKVHKIQFSTAEPDVFATANETGDIRLWRLGDDVPFRLFQHEAMVRSVQFHPDGKFLASCSNDRTARIWNLESGEPAGQPLRDEGPITWCQFSPDGRLLGTSGASGNIIFWDWKTGEVVSKLESPQRQQRFDFSPDGSQVCSASGFSFARVWSIDNSQPPWSFPHPSLNSVDWHPTQPLVVAGGDREGDLDSPYSRIWNTKTGLSMSPKLPHAKSVWSQFSPDGTALLSRSYDNTARIWSLEPTTYDIETLRSLSTVLSGSSMLDQRLIPATASVQVRTFEELRKRIPQEFTPSQKERQSFAGMNELRK